MNIQTGNISLQTRRKAEAQERADQYRGLDMQSISSPQRASKFLTGPRSKAPSDHALALPQTHRWSASDARSNALLRAAFAIAGNDSNSDVSIAGDDSNSDEWDDIAGPEELDPALQIQESAAWDVIRRKSSSRTMRSVSCLAKGGPAVTTAGFPIGRYREGQRLLENRIPGIATQFLRDLERIDAKNLLPKILTRAESAYFRDLAVKSPALTMPNVFNTVQPRSTEPNTDHYELYRRDFDFKPSEYFLTIIESIWSEIDKQKRDIYYPVPTSAKAEAALSATSSTPTAGH